MILSAVDIKWLHVEASSKCNAWCPACPRNNQGFGLAAGVVEQDLLPGRLEELLHEFPAVEGIQFCGNLGDPIASAHINELITIAKKYVKKIQIHTNGSLRNENWWKELALILSDTEHDVWFGIDGLEGVHEIYRQGTDFNKVIQNAKSFIDNGGKATWQFIPYKHNEHQVMKCLKMSQSMGFKNFKIANFYRIQTIARHYKTGKEFDLRPTESLRKLTSIDNIKTTVLDKNCMHLSMPSIYVSANGVLSRCCYLAMQESFSNSNDLLSNAITDLNDQVCIRNCG